MGRAVLLEIQVRRDPPAHKFSSVQFTRTTHTVSKDGARPAPLPSVNTSAEYIHVLARSGYSNLRDLGQTQGDWGFFKKASISIQDIIISTLYHGVSLFIIY
jgi:hypothetical protein